MKLKKLLLFGIVVMAITSISRGQASWGTQIGHTCYDLHTNSAVRNGLFTNPDGTMAAVWIQNHTCTPIQPDGDDRGIGYNYYDGASWVYGINGECPSPIVHGCASDYIGWPNIVHCGVSLKEVVISHFLGTVYGMSKTDRPTAGSGAWNTTAFVPVTNILGGNGLTWPRIAVDGDYIHIIISSPGSTTIGVTASIAYYRLSYCGDSVDIDGYMLPGLDSTNFDGIGGDSYSIDARDSVVAITAGGWGNAWTLWKSTQNGDTGTWSRTVIAPFDTTNKFYNGAPNDWIVWTNDDAHSVIVDKNGVVHVSAGQVAVQVDDTGATTGSYYPLANDGLYYWNDNMDAPLIVSGLVDLPNWITGDTADGDPSSGIGNDFPVYFTGITSTSQVSVDQNNNPYIVYAGMVEWTSNTGDTSGQTYRDLYLAYSNDGGNSWAKPVNIAGQIAGVDDGSSGTGFEEDQFPMTNREIGTDSLLHVVWQEDSEPGNSLQPDPPEDPVAINYIMHYSFNISTDLPAWDPGAFVMQFDSAVSNSATCGNANGSINVYVSGGSGVVHADFAYFNIPYLYSIDSGATYQDTSFFGSLPSGVYYVFVKDVLNATVSTTVIINELIGVTAGFLFTTTDQTATFTDASLGAVSWAWDFGDGAGTDSVQNPTYTFLTDSTYYVCLTATDACGNMDTICDSVKVLTGFSFCSALIASFTSDTSNLMVNFTDASVGVGADLNWAWDFGDASPVDSTQNPSHLYTVEGTYNVCLTITDSCGVDTTFCESVTIICPVPAAGFSFITDTLTATFTDTSSGAVSWAWDFGDGSSVDTNQSPSHTYAAAVDSTYNVCLTVTNICGSNSTCMDVTVMTTTGIFPGRLALGSVKVYPNPANDLLIVEINDLNNGSYDVELYDHMGRLVRSYQDQSSGKLKINRKNLGAGLYLLRVKTAKGIYSNKIVFE